ncbi:hypothetical protein [Rufibacter psychrotolerans]|uniref:hypothetical protein n=1 Tax=Rufibacter psychrotolerans TaxID=2812556 RepID=UPI00196730B4|nr:hypothetical protein [Rufibacter sp. SYSU D00308]
MASMFIVGNTLVDTDEFLEKKQFGGMADLATSLKDKKERSIEFSSGSVKSSEIIENFNKIDRENSTLKELNPYTPIGLGKPLTIEILTVYTGDYPNGLFKGKKDLLLVSGVKSSVTFDAASRAINKIEEKANESTYIEFSALESGSRVVYHSPAVDSLNTTVSFELVADTFKQEVFDQISRLLKSAAGLPVFLPAANYLLGGSHLIKLAGDLGNTLFAKKGYFKDSYDVKFNNAGDLDAVARQVLIVNDQDINQFAAYESRLVEQGGETKFRLVHKQTGAIYSGNAPYLILNLDGQRREDLKSFTPKLASSAILQKFYGDDDMGGKLTSTIELAMQLYNDMNYKTKAEKLKKVLETIAEGSDEYNKNLALYEAYKNNIMHDDFKIK